MKLGCEARDYFRHHEFAVGIQDGAMGIRDRPTTPRSPWQNGHTERLIGSIRHECLDHVVVFSERMHQYSGLFRPSGAILRHQ